jgi:hypothetical protein
MAPPGANISQDEERGRPIIPTFPDIRTSSLFANGMQAMRIHQLTDFLVMGTWSETDLKPGWEGFSAGGIGRRRGAGDV